MDNKKIYISISHLMFNVIKNNKLKYYLRKDEAFRKEVIKLIDLLLLLESDKFKCRYNRKKIAAEFAKAYVKITKVSNRFEVPEDEMNSEEIYAEYSRVVGFISENYKTARKTLTNEEELFTIEDIELNGKLSADFVKKMDEKLADEAKEKAEKEAKEKAEKEKTNSEDKKTTNSENINQQNFKQQNFNQQQNFFGGNMGGDMPQNIFLNPKFYPFKTKPKYMPILKKCFTLLMLITIVFYVTLVIYVGTVRVDLDYKNQSSLIHVLLPKAKWEAGFEYWIVTTSANAKVPSFSTNVDIFAKSTTNIGSIIFAIFYLLWFGYIGYTFWKKQDASRLKFRVSGFTLLIVAVFVFFLLFETAGSISNDLVMKKWNSYGSLSIKLAGETNPIPINDFNYYDDFIAKLTLNYASQLKVVTSLSICAFVSSILTLMGAIMLVIINPKKDVQKIMKARAEQANATMAAMQGKHYEIDSSLFDEDEQK
ncbi:hypothetical protein MENTO_v1c03810 [Mesoplasma entomophilum]|uniref:Uncharacterized protein n=1 Tax=Mesoplasma entomophilum TaxID=2149 RepID=A0A3S5XZP8_9MOLU|nr:hypothetical protein [Mesoplasma entomophilum]ATQ35526.1 hypothetical protein CS528_01960 [Mesoplasma entomophilum]ATZ19487.1 hypothetical protein MENTO_v1c03810 [Mesoplasma entomophilum]